MFCAIMIFINYYCLHLEKDVCELLTVFITFTERNEVFFKAAHGGETVLLNEAGWLKQEASYDSLKVL